MVKNSFGGNSFLKDHWSRHAVVYEIYPLSFKDSNGDGKGDIGGILEKIDYLNDGTDNSLGINALWICPVYSSPLYDFGYDISNFTDIDPVFGDMKTFERLVSELHRRDIKLIMDLVGNHTSSEHPWFAESRSSKENPKRNWYVWKDPKPDGGPPNNWISVFGGSAWELDKHTGQYYLHSFLKEQPDLNWRNEEVQAAMANVFDFWVSKGVDGFRLDAMHYFLEDENYRDDLVNPDYVPGKDDPYKALLHSHSRGSPDRSHIIGSFISEVLEKNKDTFIISEAYVDLKDLERMYNLAPNGRYAPFNFNLMSLPWDAQAYKYFIDDYEAMLRPDWMPTYVIGNHDSSRVATRLGEERARLAAFMCLTLRGMMFIYNGDEIGMQNTAIDKNAIQDNFEKLVPGFGLGRDPERTPMQWNDSPHGGFTTGDPWLPVNPDYKIRNVEVESSGAHSMLSMYKLLIRLRASMSALCEGEYIPRQSTSKDVLSYIRKYKDQQILIMANFSDKPVAEPLHNLNAELIASSYMDSNKGTIFNDSYITLRPHEGLILKL